MKELQDSPNTIKVEMTEGCNLRCGMCAIQGIREKAGGPYKFLTVELARKIAMKVRSTGWNSKVEFTLRGEPLMNPYSAEIVGVFRKELPTTHLMITSNALPLLRKPGVHGNLDILFSNGLNVLALDAYKPSAKAIERVRQYNGVEIFDYLTGGGVSPYKKVPVSVKRIVIMEDFETLVMSRQKLGVKIGNNHAGVGLPPTEEPLKKRCVRPFRELVIRHDGKIPLCCNDWRGEYKIGDVSDYKSLIDLWNNPEFHAVRVSLYHRDRDFNPCGRCSDSGYRLGLLPDKLGKKTLPEPTKATRRIIQRTSGGEPYTKPVLREWEKIFR